MIGGLGCLRRNSGLSIRTKVGMLLSNVVLTVLYVSEKWVLSSRERRTEMFDMKPLRIRS